MRYGQTYSFLPTSGDDPVPRSAFDYDCPGSVESFGIRKEDSLEDLQDVLHFEYSVSLPEPAGIKEWLVEVFESNRGSGTGHFQRHHPSDYDEEAVF